MPEKDLRKRFTKNLTYAFIAQGFSFVFSGLMSLLVPKVLGVEQYSYFQLFIFYSSYVGLFHFGLSDGVYLKHGGTELENLNKESIGSQFTLMVIWQVLICACTLPVILQLVESQERRYIWIFVAIYLIAANATWFFGYVFQAANRTSVYSASIILSKAAYISFVIAMLIIRPYSFKPFVAFYVAAQIIAFVYVAYEARNFILSGTRLDKEFVKETIKNCYIGISLTISNIASSLILGVGRIMVERTMGIVTFGFLSLALTITNFFLQFIAQISMVMFPALRQIEEETMKRFFLKMRSGISYLLCLMLWIFVPLKLILIWWLPQYEEALEYLAILLPICVFDGKMQLLFNSYMKVFRKERNMLYINLVSLGISIALCAASVYWIGNIFAVALATMIAVALRSIIANEYLSRIMGVQKDKKIIWEIVLVSLFILINIHVSDLFSFLIYGVAYAFYLLINRNEIKELMRFMKGTFR